ncbi:MAG: hypothetical protein ACSLFR_16855 [Solirubrobacteraceae bacterium]
MLTVLIVGTMSAGAPAAQATVTLTPRGIGHLEIGQTVKQASKASGRRIVLQPDAFGPGCRYARIPSLRAYAMLSYGRIVRIDVSARSSKVRALGGIGIGDDERAVLEEFGPKVTRTQHTYVPEGSYLTVGWRSGRYKNRGIRFETDEEGTVSSFYAGRRDQIRYVEGCA